VNKLLVALVGLALSSGAWSETLDRPLVKVGDAEVKHWVKSVEEYYSNGGARNERYTQELESFKPAEPVAQ
jgi:hypothetical protein